MRGDISIINGKSDSFLKRPSFMNKKSEKFNTVYNVLRDICNTSSFNELFNNFFLLVDLPCAIIDLDANVLASSKWQTICKDFHRINKKTCENCIQSDTQLANNINNGDKFTIYTCKNGLTDCASPIIIDNEHIANIFVGQFLIKSPDFNFFEKQAKEYGFNKLDYINALNKVKVIDEKEAKNAINFLSSFTKTIASLGLEKINAIKAEYLHQKTLEKKISYELAKNTKMHHELFNSEKRALIGDIFTNIAHQWRQPLSVVSTLSTGLQLNNYFSKLSHEELNEKLNIISNNIQLISKSIDEYKEYYIQKEREYLSLNNILYNFIYIISNSTTKYNITIIKLLDKDTSLLISKSELIQCLLNIYNHYVNIP